MPAVRTSIVPPYAAYLRVYEPLEAFPEPDRSRWAAYVASQPADGAGQPASRDTTRHGRWRSSAPSVVAEQRQAFANLVKTPPVAVPMDESGEAFVIVAADDGHAWICPWQTRLRSWVALEELQDTMPDAVVAAVLPRAAVEEAQAEFDRWRARYGSAVPCIVTSTWQVPLWWFVAFADDERRLDLGPDRSVTYRTPMVEARRRLARARRVLHRTVEEGPVTEGVEQLGRWLEHFHPRSLVELDYGGLVHLLDDDVLDADRSAADVAGGLAALRDGDPEPAVAAYRRLLARWRWVQALEHAN